MTMLLSRAQTVRVYLLLGPETSRAHSAVLPHGLLPEAAVLIVGAKERVMSLRLSVHRRELIPAAVEEVEVLCQRHFCR